MASLQSALVRFLLRRSDIWNKTLSDIRKDMEKIKSKGLPDGVEFKKDTINDVCVEKIVPCGALKNKAILYFHGGGFCLGIYSSNREFVARIAKESGLQVILVDYRLAPEHPFPEALEDAVSVYKGLLQESCHPKDIIVMGDSSGCGLALSALLVLKQSSMAMPLAAAFITPVFDFTGKSESFKTRAKKDPFKLTDPLGIAKIYVEDNEPTSAVISPLYGQLDGLPPMLVHAADYDVFLCDSIKLQEKALKAGINIELKVWTKMWHIFHMQASIVPEAQKAMNEIYTYINERLK
ncbi:MAG: alpha/beta hydrolase [Firmicutes bacterium]|nr:alpha/beta hydrolase [Bacillota bacterium]